MDFLNLFMQAGGIKKARFLYIDLIKKNHPDKGGSVELCQLINAAFDKFLKTYTPPEQETEQETEQAKSPFNDYKDFSEVSDISSVLRCKIMAVAHLDGIDIELCGSWLWLTGDTKKYAKILKAAGFWFSPKKCAWYFHEGKFSHFKFKGMQELDLDDIRERHGSYRYKKEGVLK